jgi:hypothetical protein
MQALPGVPPFSQSDLNLNALTSLLLLRSPRDIVHGIEPNPPTKFNLNVISGPKGIPIANGPLLTYARIATKSKVLELAAGAQCDPRQFQPPHTRDTGNAGFCSEHGITCEIEVIPMSAIDEAYERMMRSDVRYHLVIDMASESASAAYTKLITRVSPPDQFGICRSQALRRRRKRARAPRPSAAMEAGSGTTE